MESTDIHNLETNEHPSLALSPHTTPTSLPTATAQHLDCSPEGLPEGRTCEAPSIHNPSSNHARHALAPSLCVVDNGPPALESEPLTVNGRPTTAVNGRPAVLESEPVTESGPPVALESEPVTETREIVVVQGRSERPLTGLLLEIQDDEDVRRVPVSCKRRLLIGSRKSKVDILVRDPTVSHRHCELSFDRGGILIKDLNSRNGTFVGGARIREAWGTEGTTILLGQSSIHLLRIAADTDEEEAVLSRPLPGIAGASSLMCRIATQVRSLALQNSPVLISGETGVGKELIARALHVEGPRAQGPFVALNVAALPRDLVESELFGHERGAFTGAVSKRSGAFAESDGGTLFLDEIGELPVDAQPKLLRALDGYEVRRIGAPGSGQRADARVIAATHVPLHDHVVAGRFRRDLYHRLEVFVIELPPLRDRPGDVHPIARALLDQMEGEIGRRTLTPAAVAQLAAYSWPGNVRELRNVLCRAAHLARTDELIDSYAVIRALRGARRTGGPDIMAIEESATVSPQNARDWLAAYNGNVSAAARAAKIPRTTFRKLLRRAAAMDTGK